MGTTDYLLTSGRAVVILDGPDELTDVALRQRAATVVDAFALRYPFVPPLVTSRRVGYRDAPLTAGLFRTAAIAPMDEARVARYAANWFAVPLERRHRYRTRLDGDRYVTLQEAGAPLWTLMHESLDADLPFIQRALRGRLEADVPPFRDRSGPERGGPPGRHGGGQLGAIGDVEHPPRDTDLPLYRAFAGVHARRDLPIRRPLAQMTENDALPVRQSAW